MKKYFLLLVILAFSSLTNATQDDFITVYGYSKTRTPENPRVFDKFIMHFNQNVAPEIGFKLKYQRNVELIEEAYKKGADLLEGADIVEIKDIINIVIYFRRKIEVSPIRQISYA